MESHFNNYNSVYVNAKIGDRFAPPAEDLDNGIAIEAGYPD